MSKSLNSLANRYLFENASLSYKEYRQLYNSPFRRIFKCKPYKPSIVNENADLPKAPKLFVSNVGVQKIVIDDLVDKIEEAFDIDLSKPMFGKYSNINEEQLKRFINHFAMNEIMNQATKSYLKKLAYDDIHTIFFKLFS